MKIQIILALIFSVLITVTGVNFIRGDLLEKKKISSKKQKKKKLPNVSIVEASKSLIIDYIELTGTVEPYHIAKLASPAEGPVGIINVREGDSVIKDQILLSIGRKEGLDASLASLKKEFEIEKLKHNRIERLVEKKSLPAEQLEDAKIAYEKAQALVIKAEESAKDYIVKAPWQGIISEIMVKEGEFVSPREVLIEMYKPQSQIVRTAVPEKYAIFIESGMKVQVTLDAYPGLKISGKIDHIYPRLHSRLRTRTVEIVLLPKLKLLPGMFARIKLILTESDDHIVLPIRALIKNNQNSSVFVLQNDQAILVDVKTAIESDNKVQILSGIKPGDKVIIAGNEKLVNSSKVNVIKNSLDSSRRNK